MPTLTTSQVCVPELTRTLHTTHVVEWCEDDPPWRNKKLIKKKKFDKEASLNGWSDWLLLTQKFPRELHLRKAAKFFGRTYKEWGNFIPEPRWKTRRGKTKTLCVKGMWTAVQLPLQGCTSPMGITFTSFFWCHPESITPFNTNNTANSRCPIGRLPPKQNPPPATSRIRVFVFFFCLHLLWSVFRQQRHAGKWWHLQLEWPLYSKDCPAGDEHQYNWWRTEFVDLSCPPSISIFPTYIHHPLPSWICLSRHSARNLMRWLHMVSVTITTLTYPALSQKKDMPAILQWISLVVVTGDGKDNTPYDAVYA